MKMAIFRRKGVVGNVVSRPGASFTTSMYLAMGVVLIAALKLTMSFGEGRKLPNDYSKIDGVITGLQRDVDQINKLQVLPKLEGSWRTANAIALMNRVDFNALEESGKGDLLNSYTGPLRSWTAQIQGETSVVLDVVRKIQSQVPTFLYDYSISGGIMKLNITIVGT